MLRAQRDALRGLPAHCFEAAGRSRGSARSRSEEVRSVLRARPRRLRHDLHARVPAVLRGRRRCRGTAGAYDRGAVVARNVHHERRRADVAARASRSLTTPVLVHGPRDRGVRRLRARPRLRRLLRVSRPRARRRDDPLPLAPPRRERRPGRARAHASHGSSASSSCSASSGGRVAASPRSSWCCSSTSGRTPRHADDRARARGDRLRGQHAAQPSSAPSRRHSSGSTSRTRSPSPRRRSALAGAVGARRGRLRRRAGARLDGRAERPRARRVPRPRAAAASRGAAPPARASGASCGSWARFGLVKFANQLSVQTVLHVDKLLVAALVSVAAVTFYVVPVLIAQRLTTLVGTVSVAFLPAATQLQRGERPPAVRRARLPRGEARRARRPPGRRPRSSSSPSRSSTSGSEPSSPSGAPGRSASSSPATR